MWLAKHSGTVHNEMSMDGMTAAHAAALEGHLECMAFLLSSAGCSALARDRAANTPLHYGRTKRILRPKFKDSDLLCHVRLSHTCTVLTTSTIGKISVFSQLINQSSVLFRFSGSLWSPFLCGVAYG